MNKPHTNEKMWPQNHHAEEDFPQQIFCSIGLESGELSSQAIASVFVVCYLHNRHVLSLLPKQTKQNYHGKVSKS